jgi:rod shape-determining protein MreD
VRVQLVIRVLLVMFVVLVAQSTVILSIRIDSVHPDLLWLLPITAALLGGPDFGALVGFWSGLAFDLFLPTPFGLSALIGCLLGYAMGAATAAMDKRAVWLRPLAAIIGSVAADMLFAVTGAVFGQSQMVQVNFLTLFLVVAISSVVFVLPVNRLMRWATAVAGGDRRSLVSAQGPESGLW